MILSIRRNWGCSGGFLDFRNRAAIPPARMVVIQPGMAINPATVRDIKTLESVNETWDPASIHRYDGPVPLTARSTLVELVCCQRLDPGLSERLCDGSLESGRCCHQLSSRPVQFAQVTEHWPFSLVAEAHLRAGRVD